MTQAGGLPRLRRRSSSTPSLAELPSASWAMSLGTRGGPGIEPNVTWVPASSGGGASEESIAARITTESSAESSSMESMSRFRATSF